MLTTEIIASTAQIVDACMRLKVAYRLAPPGITPVVQPNSMIYGSAIPVRHYGSVDVFLERLESANETQKGVLVIDNGGRTDEACIGDLVVLEVKQAGHQAIVLWGLHRDTLDLMEIGLPVFSYGRCPAGPSRLDAREPDAFSSARFGDCYVTKNDTVFLDLDGVVFVETINVEKVLALATDIRQKELKQAEQAKIGLSLRDQFQFRNYLEKKNRDEGYTFRKHLSEIAKAIEE